MIEFPNALTAQELHARLRRDGHPVGLNTVYRTLGALAETGAVHTFARQGELAFRRCSTSHHQHLICVRCGRVDDVSDARIENRVTAIARSAGYTLRSHRTDLYGICPTC